MTDTERFNNRIKKIQASLAEKKYDALLITHPQNVSYFTGRKGDDCFLWIDREEAVIITDFRYREMAQGMSWLKFYETDLNHSLSAFIKHKDSRLIAVEKEHIFLNDYLMLSEKLSDRKFIPVSGMVESFRMIKDEQEIELTKKACSIACETFDYILDIIKPGLTEKDLALEIEYHMKKLGAEGTSFDTIAITGKKTSMPHGVPGNEVIKNGDFVTMDYGCFYNGYASDMTRTVAVGSISDEMKSVYGIVLKAQLNACEKIHAGLTGKECDAFARNIIEDAGYGEYFGHGLGHGTGLEIHEAPRFSPGYEGIIPENSICSIEPGIYLPGKFGVRIEDLAIVKANGIIKFVDSPKELIIL